jgi:hypothetical protein
MKGAERAFDAQTFPPTWRLAPAPAGLVLIPTTPEGPKMLAVLDVRAFIEMVAKTFGAESAFEAQTSPATLRVAPPPVVLIPTNPVVPKIPVTFTLGMLADKAKTELNLFVELPKVEKAEPARMFPEKVEEAPWTVRFCWRIVFPVVFESPKFVTSFDISSAILCEKRKGLKAIDVRAQAELARC